MRVQFTGSRIHLSFQPGLTAYKGKLLSHSPKGEPVHAGSFIPRRRVILDSELARHRGAAIRILLHELFHFAWVRLSNARRRDWERLLIDEGNARGELGWSSEYRRDALSPSDARLRSRRWREYACESFCDTAAWRFGTLRSHSEFTLAEKWRKRRAAWMDAQFGDGEPVRV